MDGDHTVLIDTGDRIEGRDRDDQGRFSAGTAIGTEDIIFQPAHDPEGDSAHADHRSLRQILIGVHKCGVILNNIPDVIGLLQHPVNSQSFQFKGTEGNDVNGMYFVTAFDLCRFVQYALPAVDPFHGGKIRYPAEKFGVDIVFFGNTEDLNIAAAYGLGQQAVYQVDKYRKAQE